MSESLKILCAMDGDTLWAERVGDSYELHIDPDHNEITFWAYSTCDKLTKVIIPEGVEYIDGGAFSDCDNLTEVVFPDSLIYIDNDAFADCPKLAAAILPDGLERISAAAPLPDAKASLK